MKCFKVTTNQTEDSVTIDGILFSPQPCTEEEERIVLDEMENDWYINSDYKTTTEYYELYHCESGSIVVYDIQPCDAVLHQNRVIGFVLCGYDREDLKGRYFSIDGHENYKLTFKSHGSYDHGDGDVDSISYCSLRKMDAQARAVMNDYCIRREKKEETRYKSITHDIVRKDETGVSVQVEVGTWIPLADAGKKVEVTDFGSPCFVSLVKKADLPEINQLMNEYCVYLKCLRNIMRCKEILIDYFEETSTGLEIASHSWADSFRIKIVGESVHACDGEKLVKKSDLREFTDFINDYCIRRERCGLTTYEEILYKELIKTEESIAIEKSDYIRIMPSEVGEKVYLGRRDDTATLVKKSDLTELNEIMSKYCICWEENGEVAYEDITYSHFVEDGAVLAVRVGKWKRLRIDAAGEKLPFASNKTAALVRKDQL